MGGRWARVFVGSVVALVGVVGFPEGAGAELNGPCRAVGVISPGDVRINPKRGDGPFTVPLEGEVAWVGQVGDGEETEPRAHNGGIEVHAPPGYDQLLGSLLEFRDWSDEDAVTTRERGTDAYTLPSATPRGTDIEVSGFHDDPAGDCDGSVIVQVEGSAFDTPLTWVAIGGTVVTGGLLVFAAAAKKVVV